MRRKMKRTKNSKLKRMKWLVNQVIVNSQMMMTMTTLRALILKVRMNFLRKDSLGRKWKNKQRKRIEELQLEDKEKIYLCLLKREDQLEVVDES